jgi:hypothetical protein
MDQPILTYSNYPFMIDIDDGVCYCYINSLLKSENPANLLRMAWYASNFVHENLLNIDSDANVLGKYQKNEIRIKGILNRMLVIYLTIHISCPFFRCRMNTWVFEFIIFCVRHPLFTRFV